MNIESALLRDLRDIVAQAAHKMGFLYWRSNMADPRERKAVGKKTRFEVFKRDSFTCQYCGKSAPDIILHVDHIDPVAAGGTNSIMNLITACQACNSGKGAIKLDDNSAVEKSNRQAKDLQERREQLKLLMEWHKGLISIDEEIVQEVASFYDDLTPGWSTNDNGKEKLRKTITKYGMNEVLESIKISVSQYGIHNDDGDLTQSSMLKINEYIEKILRVRKSNKDKPYLSDLFYVIGIMKNRFRRFYPNEIMPYLEKAYLAGVPLEDIKIIAIKSESLDESITEIQAATYKIESAG